MKSHTAISIGLALVCASCGGDVRLGMAYAPIGLEMSEGPTIEAIQHSLEPAERSCSVKLLERGKIETIGPSATLETLSAGICAQRYRYKVQRTQMKDGSVMLGAQRI